MKRLIQNNLNYIVVFLLACVGGTLYGMESDNAESLSPRHLSRKPERMLVESNIENSLHASNDTEQSQYAKNELIKSQANLIDQLQEKLKATQKELAAVNKEKNNGKWVKHSVSTSGNHGSARFSRSVRVVPSVNVSPKHSPKTSRSRRLIDAVGNTDSNVDLMSAKSKQLIPERLPEVSPTSDKSVSTVDSVIGNDVRSLEEMNEDAKNCCVAQ